MPGITDNGGPYYISSHSADVILSDIRPIKLKIEALRSINVLLDEFLYSILNTARSLSTDKLRASLLSLLPTTLGKEALLEAEVELRAYWDRTGPADVTVLEDDAKTFQLQWAFELLRLKCEAYSTLNETDEDPGAESRVSDKMRTGGGVPPKSSLMAPAALYLTAILEAMCEHILSNVGRVASRDSSRTAATPDDLFVALCEDDSIYSFFKSMKVYEQIEQLCKGPQSRRSKSFSRNDKNFGIPTHQDVSNPKDGTLIPSRNSSESGMTATAGPTPTPIPVPRSSFDKGRAMKIFRANSRSSTDRDGDLSQISHKKSDSFPSENSKQGSSYLVVESTTVEDETMQKEFDDLMRSSATMKVSLTPDRLKTMEVYKQEKDQRSNRRPGPLSLNSGSDTSVISSRGSPRRSSLLPVESIKEDDEESPIKPSRARQGSVGNPPKSFASSSRVRAVSTSGVTPRILMRLPRTTSPPVSMPFNVSGSLKSQNHLNHIAKGPGQDPIPRTRTVQQNRESIDLDDIMGESDDESIAAPPPPTKQMHVATSPIRSRHAVSASTRDLMDFLDRGPPDTGDSFSEGLRAGDSVKSKGSKRLQKMISKLSLGGGDKSRGSSDDLLRAKTQGSSRTLLEPKTSTSNLPPLANRPIPPRPPPVSPLSPSPDSFDESSPSPHSHSASVGQRKQDLAEAIPSELSPAPPTASSYRDRGEHPLSARQPFVTRNINGHDKPVTLEEPLKRTTLPTVNTAVNGVASAVHSPGDVSPIALPRLSSASSSKPVTPTKLQARKPPPVYLPTPHLGYDDVRNIHRLLSRATSADECRLIFDMFIAKSGIKLETSDHGESQSLHPPSVTTMHTTSADAPLESSLVEFLLGGSDLTSELAIHEHQANSELHPSADPPLRSNPDDLFRVGCEG